MADKEKNQNQKPTPRPKARPRKLKPTKAYRIHRLSAKIAALASRKKSFELRLQVISADLAALEVRRTLLEHGEREER